MGIEVERFIGDHHNPFICPVCLDVEDDPVVTPCDHLFCKICFTPGRCPTCRRNVRQTEPMSRILTEDYESLKLKCPFQRCNQELIIGNFRSHGQSCPFRSNECPTCGYKMEEGHNSLKEKIAALELQVGQMSVHQGLKQVLCGTVIGKGNEFVVC